MAYVNNCPLKEGFLEVPLIKAEKTIPIPTPAPLIEIVANPAAINFALANIIKILFRPLGGTIKKLLIPFKNIFYETPLYLLKDLNLYSVV